MTTYRNIKIFGLLGQTDRVRVVHVFLNDYLPLLLSAFLPFPPRHIKPHYLLNQTTTTTSNFVYLRDRICYHHHQSRIYAIIISIVCVFFSFQKKKPHISPISISLSLSLSRIHFKTSNMTEFTDSFHIKKETKRHTERDRERKRETNLPFRDKLILVELYINTVYVVYTR